jgi:hypothetical protein
VCVGRARSRSVWRCSMATGRDEFADENPQLGSNRLSVSFAESRLGTLVRYQWGYRASSPGPEYGVGIGVCCRSRRSTQVRGGLDLRERGSVTGLSRNDRCLGLGATCCVRPWTAGRLPGMDTVSGLRGIAPGGHPGPHRGLRSSRDIATPAGLVNPRGARRTATAMRVVPVADSTQEPDRFWWMSAPLAGWTESAPVVGPLCKEREGQHSSVLAAPDPGRDANRVSTCRSEAGSRNAE